VFGGLVLGLRDQKKWSKIWRFNLFNRSGTRHPCHVLDRRFEDLLGDALKVAPERHTLSEVAGLACFGILGFKDKGRDFLSGSRV